MIKRHLLLFLVLFAGISFAGEFEAKSAHEITARIIQSGSLSIDGYIESASLTLHIPQEGIQNMNVKTSGTIVYVYDNFGNKMLKLEWNSPKGVLDYTVVSDVKSTARHLTREINLADSNTYVAETGTIFFTPEIRKEAYFYEKNVKGAAEMAKWVNSYVTYDKSLVGGSKTSEWVYENRHGVCVEYASLLAAMLRSKGIPTRYVVGYSYSDKDNNFIGHTWLEIMAEDTSWIGIDPTWLEAGYLDATHIKTANLMDDNQTDTLRYTGTGTIEWERNDEKFEIIDYSVKNITKIYAEGGKFALNKYGIIHATVSSDECQIVDLKASSCVGEDNNKMINIYGHERIFWLCGSDDVYWAFGTAGLSPRFEYTCPVAVYDQAGTNEQVVITISENKKINEISISGPSSVNIGEDFKLEAHSSGSFIFFSPEFGRHDNKEWELNLRKPEKYTFYLYSDGALATKDVSVLEKKEFELTVSNPSNASKDSTFLVSVKSRSMLDSEKNIEMLLEFDNNVIRNNLVFEPDEEKNNVLNLTAKDIGLRKITVSLMGETLTGYSTSIFVYEQKKQNFLDEIAKFFEGIFKWFARLFG